MWTSFYSLILWEGSGSSWVFFFTADSVFVKLGLTCLVFSCPNTAARVNLLMSALDWKQTQRGETFHNGFLSKPTHLFDRYPIYLGIDEVRCLCDWPSRVSICLSSGMVELHFVTPLCWLYLLFLNMKTSVTCVTWETTEWISLLFPGHLPILGIVAVGSGLALIIFGISSFLIYRWVSHPAHACCLLTVHVKKIIIIIIIVII